MDIPNLNKDDLDIYKPNLMLVIALGFLILLGIGFQLEAVYADYLVNKTRIEEPGLTICFYSPYSMRGVILLFGVLGLGLSYSILYKRYWMISESYLVNSVLFSPILIFVLDQLIIRMLY